VDVLEERLDLLGFMAPDSGDAFELAEVFTANELSAESSLAHIDALIYGVTFVTVGSGMEDEPDPLVTVGSPETTTCLWDRRARRVAAALHLEADDRSKPVTATLYLPNETIRVDLQQPHLPVLHRDQHNLGRPLVARIVNRPWGARREGRSEISRAVRTYTDQAVRTLLAAEVSREFYAAPQRWVMGASDDSFVDADGQAVPAWETYLGRFLSLERDDDGQLPTTGQFPASSPAPYFDQIKALAQMFAAEAGLPASYLGFATENPASADAIKAGEARLLKRSERRQVQFGAGWRAVAGLALLVRDGALPAGFDQLTTSWSDPSTPTRAAAADAAVKLVAAEVLPADSPVTWDMIGLSPTDQARLLADVRRARTARTVAGLVDAAIGTDATATELAVAEPDTASTAVQGSEGGLR
jgi:hypothetical protein